MVDRSMYSKDPEEYSEEHFDDPLHQKIQSQRKPFWKNKKILIGIGAAVVAVVLIVVFVFAGQNGTYTGDKVFLEIDGTEATTSGGEVSYRINCINKEEVNLEDVEVGLIFPETFSFISSTLDRESNNIWKVGEIETGHSKDFEVKGTLSGISEAMQTVKGTMNFTPKGIGSSFEVESEFSTVISSGDVTVVVDAPETTTSGSNIEYLVRYENKGDETVQNLFLKMTYPEGFAYAEARPKPAEGSNTWKLPAMKSGSKGEVLIKGSITGSKDEAMRVTAELGSKNDSGEFFLQTQNEDSTRIVESAESITATILGETEIVTDPGQEFKVVIKYQNQGSVALKNAIVEFELNPDIVDFSKLNISGGAYEEGKIVWNSSGISELSLIQPNDGGEIEFKLPIKNRAELPISSITDKNFAVNGQAVLIGSEDERVESVPLVIKLNSFLTIVPQGLYYDQYGGEPIGSGPMPPKVGEKTTYHITLFVENLANDLGEVEVSVPLAPGVKWEDNEKVSHGQDLEFDSKANKIIWRIGKVPANTGTFSEKMVASFDISITPGADKVGDEPELLKQTTYTGNDTFTETALLGESAGLTTELPDDKFAKDQGEVQP